MEERIEVEKFHINGKNINIIRETDEEGSVGVCKSCGHRSDINNFVIQTPPPENRIFLQCPKCGTTNKSN